MYSNDFEAAFSCFLERRDYDEAANQMFTLARLAFAAGWQAAGGPRLRRSPSLPSSAAARKMDSVKRPLSRKSVERPLISHRTSPALFI